MAKKPTPKSAAEVVGNGPMFYAPAGSPAIPVDLPDGSRAIVTRTPRTLPRKFWTEARKRGCFTQEQGNIEQLIAAAPETPASSDQSKRLDLLVSLIDEAANQAEDAPGFENAFLSINDGDYPNADWLERRTGFTPSEEEVAQAWSIVQDRIARTPDANDEG